MSQAVETADTDLAALKAPVTGGLKALRPAAAPGTVPAGLIMMRQGEAA